MYKLTKKWLKLCFMTGMVLTLFLGCGRNGNSLDNGQKKSGSESLGNLKEEATMDGRKDREDKKIEIKMNDNLCITGARIEFIDRNNDLYRCGAGKNQSVLEPQKILEDAAMCTKLAAINQEGDLYCWGNNEYGQVGDIRIILEE